MLTLDLPPDVQQFLQDEVANDELVAEAVRLLRDGNRQFHAFREQLQARVAGLQRGEGIELEDDEALERFFDQVESEVAAESTQP
jgi:Arc/MetJ-type ribon-helix-helix transcriptional regulator